jgi:hypothetical protein
MYSDGTDEITPTRRDAIRVTERLTLTGAVKRPVQRLDTFIEAPSSAYRRGTAGAGHTTT